MDKGLLWLGILLLVMTVLDVVYVWLSPRLRRRRREDGIEGHDGRHDDGAD